MAPHGLIWSGMISHGLRYAWSRTVLHGFACSPVVSQGVKEGLLSEREWKVHPQIRHGSALAFRNVYKHMRRKRKHFSAGLLSPTATKIVFHVELVVALTHVKNYPYKTDNLHTITHLSPNHELELALSVYIYIYTSIY